MKETEEKTLRKVFKEMLALSRHYHYDDFTLLVMAHRITEELGYMPPNHLSGEELTIEWQQHLSDEAITKFNKDNHTKTILRDKFGRLRWRNR